MGLPAFDMSAFEAAQAAVKPAPRASTSIIIGPGVRSHAQEAPHREKIRKGVDQFVDEVNQWRSGAFAGAAQMRVALETGIHQAPLSYVAKLAIDFHEHMRELEDSAKRDLENDQVLMNNLKVPVDEAATYSTSPGKFLRREIKRLEHAMDLRNETYERLTLSLGHMLNQLVNISKQDTLSGPSFADDAARSSYIEGLQSKPVDLVGVAERTRRRLKQFPKVASYLAGQTRASLDHR